MLFQANFDIVFAIIKTSVFINPTENSIGIILPHGNTWEMQEIFFYVNFPYTPALGHCKCNNKNIRRCSEYF